MGGGRMKLSIKFLKEFNMFLKFPISIFIFLSCFLVYADQEEVKQLFTAVENNDIPQVKRLFQQGVDPNDRIREEDTGLYSNYALTHSPTAEMTQLLLDGGADPNLGNSRVGGAPIFNYRSIQQLEVLLKGGADPNGFFYFWTTIDVCEVSRRSRSIIECRSYTFSKVQPRRGYNNGWKS